jgi:ribosome-binding ATPase YchF (GTP1/OBG family)
MGMKLWNFVEIVSEIKNATIYVENYTNEQDNSDGKEIHRVEMNVEDTDTEIISASYTLEAESKKALDQQVKFTLGGYFNKIDVVNKLY